MPLQWHTHTHICMTLRGAALMIICEHWAAQENATSKKWGQIMTSKTRAEGIIQHPLVVWLRLRVWISSTFIPPLCWKFSQYFVCVLWIWSRHLNHKCSIMPYIQYGSSEAYLPRRMVISEGCGSLPWNVPVLCGTLALAQAVNMHLGELCGKWACYMWRKEGKEALLGLAGEAWAHSCWESCTVCMCVRGCADDLAQQNIHKI